MSLEIIKDPAKSFKYAKKKKNINHTTSILATNSFIITVGLAFAVFKNSIASVTPLMVLSLSVTTFFVVILMAIIFGWTLQIISNALGGKGKYFEGFTAFVYSLTAPSLGILIAAFFAVIPQSWPITFILLVPSFGLGIATLYRGIKDLFKMDMVTTFVVVSITTMSFFISIYTIVTLNILSSGVLV